MPLHKQSFPGALRAVAIFGPGLIGGSLAKALILANPDLEVRLWSRPSSCERAREVFPHLPISSCVAEAIKGVDVAVLCVPVDAMRDLAKEMRDELGSGCVVTDAGSTKALACEFLEQELGGRFVGAHPMAGSEQSGCEAARADLFQNATCIVTPTEKTEPEALATVCQLWQDVGGNVVTMSPEEHDRLVGRASHLPHAVAAILARAVGLANPGALAVAGRGFLDTTRIAAGPEEMWAGIFLDNRENLLRAIEEFSVEMERLTGLLEKGDRQSLQKFLQEARKVRMDFE